MQYYITTATRQVQAQLTVVHEGLRNYSYNSSASRELWPVDKAVGSNKLKRQLHWTTTFICLSVIQLIYNWTGQQVTTGNLGRPGCIMLGLLLKNPIAYHFHHSRKWACLFKFPISRVFGYKHPFWLIYFLKNIAPKVIFISLSYNNTDTLSQIHAKFNISPQRPFQCFH